MLFIGVSLGYTVNRDSDLIEFYVQIPCWHPTAAAPKQNNYWVQAETEKARKRQGRCFLSPVKFIPTEYGKSNGEELTDVRQEVSTEYGTRTDKEGPVSQDDTGVARQKDSRVRLAAAKNTLESMRVSFCDLVGKCCPVNSTGSLDSLLYSEKNAGIFVESCLLLQSAKRMPGTALGQSSTREASLKSFITSYPPMGQSRFRVDRVNVASARQTLKYLWRPPGRLQSVSGGRQFDFKSLSGVESLYRATPATGTAATVTHRHSSVGVA
ncbi:hypothetical protein PoB_002193200 [Plakobranchus ocellatus]|uniref:Uncharacterized protein n=1 Tax=Plakobranchus ocellatus TaxID=259542 RepID=A0AAV3ZLB5_9GAST|nr:hypothetical protein PoB_002193200 [Plakobranchus ocellatus]